MLAFAGYVGASVNVAGNIDPDRNTGRTADRTEDGGQGCSTVSDRSVVPPAQHRELTHVIRRGVDFEDVAAGIDVIEQGDSGTGEIDCGITIPGPTAREGRSSIATSW
jgi:hypothetical protein